jgi:hypothetical protein
LVKLFFYNQLQQSIAETEHFRDLSHHQPLTHSVSTAVHVCTLTRLHLWGHTLISGLSSIKRLISAPPSSSQSVGTLLYVSIYIWSRGVIAASVLYMLLSLAAEPTLCSLKVVWLLLSAFCSMLVSGPVSRSAWYHYVIVWSLHLNLNSGLLCALIWCCRLIWLPRQM